MVNFSINLPDACLPVGRVGRLEVIVGGEVTQRMDKYEPKKIEPKWQQFWQRAGSHSAPDMPERKFYCLVEFPYPSGEGLHVGHVRPYTGMDALSRKRRMEGYDVLFPIGFDAFGLPTENYAIKTRRQPAEITKENIASFSRQLLALGLSFDWARQVNTTDPGYYRWTQWIFLQLFKEGLAYKARMPINWCPSCKIGLANEEVVAGSCERCGTPVEQREREQWMLRITKYAERLLEDLTLVDYPERVKVQQMNWIGRSEGVNIRNKVKGMDIEFFVYDSIPQTFMAQTFTIIAPEHALVRRLVAGTEHEKEVLKFVDRVAKRKAAGKFNLETEMEGIFTGRYVENYLGTGRELPIWVASYVVADYGTGIVNCSVHDERDFQFAKKYGLPLHAVLFPSDKKLADQVRKLAVFYRQPDGVLAEPSRFEGMTWAEARQPATDHLVNSGFAERAVNYRLRDWVFSRQRYWGEPIPMVHCAKCGQTNQKVLLIHGFEGRGDANWLPWMKAELEQRGFTVFNPTMSSADHPDLDQWMAELLPYLDQLNEHDIVIGHSLGGKAALHLLERGQRKIGHLFLVAATIGKPSEQSWQHFSQVWPKADLAALRKFWEEGIDLKAASALAGQVRAVLSEDDEDVSRATHAHLPSQWQFDLWQGFKHFTDKKIPKLLDYILQAKEPGWVPVPEEQLPVELPAVERYQPTDTGESPLASITDWVETTCPQCGGPARRETDVMPNWAGSNWYFLRYLDPSNRKVLVDKRVAAAWMPVDWYNGGMEHTTLHLLYSRFIYKFLWDIGAVPQSCGPEPYAKRTSHGLILGQGGEKMSKSKGNVVNPDTIAAQYGTDTLRTYIMFVGPFEQAVPWDQRGVVGIQRFLERAWKLAQELDLTVGVADVDPDVLALVHQTVRKVGQDIETMDFNTAISALMILANRLADAGRIHREGFESFLQLLAPFAPHLAEELWQRLGNKQSIFTYRWPSYDPELAKAQTVQLVVQVNGKLRARLTVEPDITQQRAEQLARQEPGVQQQLAERPVRNVIFVPNRLINFVV